MSKDVTSRYHGYRVNTMGCVMKGFKFAEQENMSASKRMT